MKQEQTLLVTIPDGLIRNKDRLFRPIDEDGFEGFIQWRPPIIDAPEGELYLKWKGTRIPLDVWHQVCAFFEKQYALTRGESQVRLFYNPDTCVWKAWAFPQEWSTGMTTKEIENHPDRKKQDAEIGVGFKVYGSVHHHCGSTAFQSGTDRTDETHQGGLHITVGKIGSKEYDLHGRVYLGHVEYKCKWECWFDIEPEWLKHVPESMREAIKDGLLKDPPPKDYAFPEQWMENLIKSTPNYSSNHIQVGFRGGQFSKKRGRKKPAATAQDVLQTNDNVRMVTGLATACKIVHGWELIKILGHIVDRPHANGDTPTERDFISRLRMAGQSKTSGSTGIYAIAKDAIEVLTSNVEHQEPLPGVINEDTVWEVAIAAAETTCSYTDAMTVLAKLKTEAFPKFAQEHQNIFEAEVRRLAIKYQVSLADLAARAWMDIDSNMMLEAQGETGLYQPSTYNGAGGYQDYSHGHGMGC